MAAERAPVRIRVAPPPFHEAQKQVAELLRHHRFVVWIAGRRVGKTKLGAAMLVASACRTALPHWWVAPTFDTGRYGWREIVRLAQQIPGARVWSPHRPTVDSRVLLPNGADLWVRSADNPDSLRGEGLAGCVVDEAADIDVTAWEDSLYAALGDRNGWALLVGTPKGPNWFHERYMAGLRGDPEYASILHPSSANPYLRASVLENARKNLPDRVYRQEYLAEIIGDGLVFPGANRCLGDVSDWGQPVDGRPARIVWGVDWGKLNDSSVVVGWDTDRAMAKLLFRDSGSDYRVHRHRMIELHKAQPAAVICAELNAMGEANVEELAAAGLPVIGITTGATDNPRHHTIDKSRAVSDLAVCLEKGEVILDQRDAVLIGELNSYTAKRSPSGRYVYSAPSGQHDDCVMALIMAQEATHRAAMGSRLEWL